jgi:serine protease AprX
VRRSALAVAFAALVALAACGVDEAAAPPGESHAVWVWLDPAAAASELPPMVGDDVVAARAVLDTDRPVDPALVARIAATGAHVRTVSRWLRAVAVDADSATLARLHALPEVMRITPIRTGEPAAARSPDGRPPAHPFAAAAAASQPDSAFYGATWAALRELNIPVLHELGFRGEGVRIAILDGGFFLGHESLRTRTVVQQRDFISRDDNVDLEPFDAPNQRRHGTLVWSLLGGLREGLLVGGAYEASFYLAKVRNIGSASRADEDRWVEAAEWADSLGVHIINSSIGFRDDWTDRPPIPYGQLDGNTTATTRAADEAARRGILVVVAIGNTGPATGSLWAPADADSIIAVGSVDRLLPGRVAVPTDISSRGPTADGRTKPELAARGANLVAASTFDAVSYEGGLIGSSFATPFITAGAALFRQAWPNLSIMAVRDALMLAGSDALRPNNVTGHGVPDVAAAIMFPGGIVLAANSLSSLDLQRSLTTVLPTFRWETPLVHARMRPILYTVQVARDSAFTDVVYSDTIREASLLTARAPLLPLERAWWRVIAEAPTGVQRVSPPQPRFRVPSWVRLLSYNEPEAVFTDSLRPTLSWAPLAAPAPVGPFTYDVHVISVATGQVVQQMLGLTTSSVRVPDPLVPNLAYRWRVIVRTQTGVSEIVESLAPFVVISDEAPPATILYPPFPNPFPNFATGITGMRVWFDLHEDGPVELHVYDLRGRLVRRLIPARADCGAVTLRAGLYGRGSQPINADAAPGCALSAWDGSHERGHRVAAGVYVVRLRAAGVTDVKRVLFMPQ